MISASIPTAYGVAAAFWAPISGAFTYRSGRLEVQIGGWVDQASYLAGAQPLVTQRHGWSAEDIAAVLGEGVSLTDMTVALMQTLAMFQPAVEPEPQPDAEV